MFAFAVQKVYLAIEGDTNSWTIVCLNLIVVLWYPAMATKTTLSENNNKDITIGKLSQSQKSESQVWYSQVHCNHLQIPSGKVWLYLYSPSAMGWIAGQTGSCSLGWQLVSHKKKQQPAARKFLPSQSCIKKHDHPSIYQHSHMTLKWLILILIVLIMS